MRNYKRILAAGLAATMVMGNSAAVFAEDQSGSTSGTGGLEGTVSTDVFSVQLPTIPESGDTTFNYVLDPEGLIAKAGKDKDEYKGKTFEEGATLFFTNTSEDKTTDFSGTSDALTVINKSSAAVSVEVKATVESMDGITMSEDKTFADDTNTSLYLALKDSASETAIKAETGATLTSTIAAAADGAYEVQWNATENKYENVLTDEAKADDYDGFSEYTFQLTGACNSAGDWSDMTETAPVVNVVWSVKDPFITGPRISIDGNGLITITNLTAEQNYGSIAIAGGDGVAYDMMLNQVSWGLDDYDETTGGNLQIQLGAGWMDYLRQTGGTADVTLTLSDGSTKTASATFATE